MVPLLLAWYRARARDLPWRRSRDPYAVWVSEIMLQQTQVNTVIPYWTRWMEALPDVKALAGISADRLHKLWEGLGYYSRVRNMQKAAVQILEQHRGRFPDAFDAVLALPGIGRYTAGAICSIAFNQPHPILDGNVIRILTRIHGIPGDPRDKSVTETLWQHATRLVQTAAFTRAGKHVCSELNQSLMELGALVCSPRNPNCAACPVREACVAHQTGRTADFPAPRQRPPSTRRQFVAVVLEHRGRFLVRKRPAGVLNAHLWEFPNTEIQLDGRSPEEIARILAPETTGPLQPLAVVRHSITRYRIILHPFRARFGSRPPRPGNEGQWLAPSQLAPLAFTSAHARILKQIV